MSTPFLPILARPRNRGWGSAGEMWYQNADGIWTSIVHPGAAGFHLVSTVDGWQAGAGEAETAPELVGILYGWGDGLTASNIVADQEGEGPALWDRSIVRIILRADANCSAVIDILKNGVSIFGGSAVKPTLSSSLLDDKINMSDITTEATIGDSYVARLLSVSGDPLRLSLAVIFGLPIEIVTAAIASGAVLYAPSIGNAMQPVRTAHRSSTSVLYPPAIATTTLTIEGRESGVLRFIRYLVPYPVDPLASPQWELELTAAEFASVGSWANLQLWFWAAGSPRPIRIYRVRVLLTVAATSFAPNATVATGGWMDQLSGSVNLHGPLADSDPDTYIVSPASPTSSSIAKVGLADFTPGVGETVTIEIDTEQA